MRFSFKIALRSWHRFLIDFGANLRPFFVPKSTKIASKIDLERHRFFHRFLIDFGSILEVNLGPCWPLFRLQKGGACGSPPLFLLRCFFESIFFRFFGPRGRWGTPFLAPKSDGVFHFWSICAPNLVPTWRHLEPLWCKSWSWMGWWGYATRKELKKRKGRSQVERRGH